MDVKLSDFARNMEAFGEDPLYIIQEYIKTTGKEIEALGMVDKSEDPTVGAGMSMDEVIEKLMNKQNLEADPDSSLAQTQAARQQQTNASRPQPQANATGPAPQPQVQSQTQPQAVPQNPSMPQAAPIPGQTRIIKKIVKIVKPAAAPAAQAVPNKVTEE